MASNPMRLTDEAEETALKYGKTVSAGIMEMESRLLHAATAGIVVAPTAVNVISAREKFMSTPVPDSGVPVMFNDAFWKKFRAEVVGALEPVSGRGY